MGVLVLALGPCRSFLLLLVLTELRKSTSCAAQLSLLGDFRSQRWAPVVTRSHRVLDTIEWDRAAVGAVDTSPAHLFVLRVGMHASSAILHRLCAGI
ncbi:hypothetical protein Mp_6g01070 [Marchantia polymorpha subsp. ruderalis]|uniref:Secreted protein n=2 Tax=Marchantia polymorpha TaxID=3197 RepID=A0AAF6BM96_MARPO|nr:hypothetical protein MARPO_0052s0097 [Marchantia polymorpha]BBN13130.1 hypothetical protein Mp_6g01070 [Marchantia polymorpha subsp. ruderalis]|eukprot:PTQ38318.1 hypothetical protein MARPO_0052s0097 [Marchantia polymorpha]